MSRRSVFAAIVLLFTTLSFHPYAMAQTPCDWDTGHRAPLP